MMLSTPTFAQGNVKLRLISTPTGAPKALEEVISKFEEETNIEVEIITAPYHSLREKVTIALEGDKGAYDVMTVPGEWLGGWAAAGFLVPIEEIEPIETAGLFPGQAALFKYNGKLYTLPYYNNVQFLFYRKDLAEEKGLAIPSDLEAFVEFAKKLTLDIDGDGKIDVYGAMVPGAPTGHLTSEFTQMIWSFGGDIFDEKGNPYFNSEAGIKALKFLRDLCYEYKVVPPWFLEMRVDTAQEDFMRGALATCYHYTSFVPIVSDPSKSLVHDKWAIAPRPGIALGSGWSFGIASGSKHKNEALALIKYITSPENMKKIFVEAGLLPSKQSVLLDEDIIEKEPLAPVFYEAILQSKPYPPVAIPEWAQVENILYTEVNHALARTKEVEQALADAEKQVLEIIAEK